MLKEAREALRRLIVPNFQPYISAVKVEKIAGNTCSSFIYDEDQREADVEALDNIITGYEHLANFLAEVTEERNHLKKELTKLRRIHRKLKKKYKGENKQLSESVDDVYNDYCLAVYDLWDMTKAFKLALMDLDIDGVTKKNVERIVNHYVKRVKEGEEIC